MAPRDIPSKLVKEAGPRVAKSAGRGVAVSLATRAVATRTRPGAKDVAGAVRDNIASSAKAAVKAEAKAAAIGKARTAVAELNRRRRKNRRGSSDEDEDHDDDDRRSEASSTSVDHQEDGDSGAPVSTNSANSDDDRPDDDSAARSSKASSGEHPQPPAGEKAKSHALELAKNFAQGTAASAAIALGKGAAKGTIKEVGKRAAVDHKPPTVAFVAKTAARQTKAHAAPAVSGAAKQVAVALAVREGATAFKAIREEMRRRKASRQEEHEEDEDEINLRRHLFEQLPFVDGAVETIDDHSGAEEEEGGEIPTVSGRSAEQEGASGDDNDDPSAATTDTGRNSNDDDDDDDDDTYAGAPGENWLNEDDGRRPPSNVEAARARVAADVVAGTIQMALDHRVQSALDAGEIDVPDHERRRIDVLEGKTGAKAAGKHAGRAGARLVTAAHAGSRAVQHASAAVKQLFHRQKIGPIAADREAAQKTAAELEQMAQLNANEDDLSARAEAVVESLRPPPARPSQHAEAAARNTTKAIKNIGGAVADVARAGVKGVRGLSQKAFRRSKTAGERKKKGPIGKLDTAVSKRAASAQDAARGAVVTVASAAKTTIQHHRLTLPTALRRRGASADEKHNSDDDATPEARKRSHPRDVRREASKAAEAATATGDAMDDANAAIVAGVKHLAKAIRVGAKHPRGGRDRDGYTATEHLHAAADAAASARRYGKRTVRSAGAAMAAAGSAASAALMVKAAAEEADADRRSMSTLSAASLHDDPAGHAEVAARASTAASRKLDLAAKHAQHAAGAGLAAVKFAIGAKKHRVPPAGVPLRDRAPVTRREAVRKAAGELKRAGSALRSSSAAGRAAVKHAAAVGLQAVRMKTVRPEKRLGSKYAAPSRRSGDEDGSDDSAEIRRLFAELPFSEGDVVAAGAEVVVDESFRSPMQPPEVAKEDSSSVDVPERHIDVASASPASTPAKDMPTSSLPPSAPAAGSSESPAQPRQQDGEEADRPSSCCQGSMAFIARTSSSSGLRKKNHVADAPSPTGPAGSAQHLERRPLWEATHGDGSVRMNRVSTATAIRHAAHVAAELPARKAALRVKDVARRFGDRRARTAPTAAESGSPQAKPSPRGRPAQQPQTVTLESDPADILAMPATERRKKEEKHEKGAGPTNVHLPPLTHRSEQTGVAVSDVPGIRRGSAGPTSPRFKLPPIFAKGHQNPEQQHRPSSSEFASPLFG